MSVFRSRGFDSLIAKGTRFTGEVMIASNSTFLVEGELLSQSITAVANTGKLASKTTLMVTGEVRMLPNGEVNNTIEVRNVVITGKVSCDVLRAEGRLAIKAGATLSAKEIYYRELIIETGSIVHGQMFHLDHVTHDEVEIDEVPDSEASK